MKAAIIATLILALASPHAQVFYGPGDYGSWGAVICVHRDRIVVYEILGGGSPGGWGRELFRVDNVTDVHVAVYCRGALHLSGGPCRWQTVTCGDLDCMLDSDCDGDVDLEDFTRFQNAFTGE